MESSGQGIGRNIFGLAVDYNGDPLQRGGRSHIYSDVSDQIKIDIKDNHFYVSVFNDPVGSLYITKMSQKQDAAIDTWPVDLAPIEGLAYPSDIARTDWGTVFVHESKPVDAREPQFFSERFAEYYKGQSEKINAYNYGWPAELIILNKTGKSKIIRNYALGRLFPRQIVMLPDERSFLILGGEGGRNLYLFVAEEKKILSKGKLYFVTNNDGTYSFEELGSTSSLRIKLKMKRIDFAEIFESHEVVDSGCPASYKYVSTSYGSECLKLKKRNKRYAGLFEPERVAAYMGLSGMGGEMEKIEYTATNNEVLVEMRDGKTLVLPSIEHSEFK
jgi:hypothetical protein